MEEFLRAYGRQIEGSGKHDIEIEKGKRRNQEIRLSLFFSSARLGSIPFQAIAQLSVRRNILASESSAQNETVGRCCTAVRMHSLSGRTPPGNVVEGAGKVYARLTGHKTIVQSNVQMSKLTLKGSSCPARRRFSPLAGEVSSLCLFKDAGDCGDTWGRPFRHHLH